MVTRRYKVYKIGIMKPVKTPYRIVEPFTSKPLRIKKKKGRKLEVVKYK